MTTSVGGSRPNPFKGLRPFHAGETLFGRDADMITMKDRLFRARTTLLFAASGVGKTSCFVAKCNPELEHRYRDRYKVVYHSEWQGRDPLVRLKAALDVFDERPLVSCFAAGRAEVGRGWIVVLDQFEELFQYQAYQPGFANFRDELSAAIRDEKCDVRVVFSIREEFLGQLSAFDHRIPDLFGNYHRLKNPGLGEAKEIVSLTCESVEAAVNSSGLDAMIDDLTRVEMRQRASRSEGFSRDSVVLPYLQLVCSELWMEEYADYDGRAHRAPFLSSYRKRRLRPGGNPAREKLEHYCDTKLRQLAPERQAIAASAFDYLVTSEGAKVSHELKSLAKHMKTNVDELSATLRALSGDTRILREAVIGAERWFELYHDMYAPIVFGWKERFEVEEELRLKAEAAAVHFDRLAAGAETDEDVERALLYRLRALESSESGVRRGAVGQLARHAAGLTGTLRHEGVIVAGAFCDDGSLVATISGATRAIGDADAYPRVLQFVAWGLESGAPVSEAVRMRGVCHGLELAHSGRFAAVITGAQVRLIDLKEASEVKSCAVQGVGKRGPSGPGEGLRVRFTSDDQWLVVEAWRRNRSALQAIPLDRFPKEITLRFEFEQHATDSRGTFVTAVDDRRLSFFDLRTGKQMESNIGPPRRLPRRVAAIYLNSDASHMAIAGIDGEVQLWNGSQWVLLQPELFRSVRGVHLRFNSHTGQLLACGIRRGGRGSLLARIEPDGTLVGEPITLTPHRLMPRLSPRGQYCYAKRPEHCIWDGVSGAPLELPWLSESRPDMVWSQDDSHVLTWGRDGAARIWSVSELLHAQARFKHDTGFLDAALSPGRPEVAIVDAEGNVRLEGTANSRPRLLNQAGAIWAGFVGDRRIASLGEDDRLSLWDLTTGKLSARIGGASGSVFIGPAADAILTWDFGGPAKWWATDSKSRVLKPLRGAFDGVACDDQSPFFASWDYEGVLMIWDWGTGRRMMSIDVGPGVGTVALSSDGKRVACGGREGRIEIWSATEKRKPRRIVHPSYVSQMAFSSSGRLLATIAEDKFVRVLEIDADKSRVAQFRRTRGSVVRVRFTNDEKRLLLQSRTWIHLLAIQDGLVPLSSLRMSGRIVDVAVLSDDGSKLSVLTRPWPGAYHLDEIDLLKYPIGEPDGHVAKLKQRVLASSGLVFQNEVLVQQPFTVSLKPRRASGAKSRARISGVAVGDFRARRIGPRRSTRSE